jgi:hypothetical protein
VVIGDNIMVKVIRSEEGDLRLAIDAPKCGHYAWRIIYGPVSGAAGKTQKNVGIKFKCYQCARTIFVIDYQQDAGAVNNENCPFYFAIQDPVTLLISRVAMRLVI